MEAEERTGIAKNMEKYTQDRIERKFPKEIKKGKISFREKIRKKKTENKNNINDRPS